MTVRVDTCVGCGDEFEQELRQGRPRTFCETCRPLKKTTAPKKASPVAAGLKADPPVREDGRCVVCLKPRKVTKQSRRYAGVQIDLDPFCSGRCCRTWHGCELENEADEQELAGARAAAARFRERTAA